jgi:predicted GIY-YIG superfamily endonuclease
MRNWWVYIVRKQEKLLYKGGLFEKQASANREKQIKRWTREKKLQLISKGTGKVR